MENDLLQLPKSQLVALLQKERKAGKNKDQILAQERDHVLWLKAQITQLKRMLFGQKRERFEAPGQIALPFAGSPAREGEELARHEKRVRSLRRKARKKATHPGRLPLPEHLPVEEVEIYPEGDLSGMVCIGTEVTEELEMDPARFYIRRYIRYKYAPKDNQKDGVQIGELPERVIDKGIPGPGLLAGILRDKYVDHLPLYRQRQRFLRENIAIAASTLDGWAAQGMDRLQILWEHLLEDTRTQGYLQADETPIKVLDSSKKGTTHQGWYWVYHNPIERVVLFDYQPTRGAPGPKRILDGFKGYLQTDGYGVYEKIGARDGVTHLACWAHARREFERALDNDRSRAEVALSYIQNLYAVERQARREKRTPEQRKQLRLEESLPILNEFGKWISEQVKQVLPKSRIGKAMLYSINRWDGLSEYLQDGLLEIDNNLIENLIRPVALGRKNYLFAGSHKGAARGAMMYSFFANCKLHQVNPYPWLRYVLEHIMSTKYNQIRDLYPQNFTHKQSD